MEPIEAVYEIPMNTILADEDFNCRGPIAPIDVIDLAKSIEDHGLIQPVTVCKADRPGYQYLLIAGYRRYQAHIVLGKNAIKATVRDKMDESTARIMNLAENLERKDLNVLQEAKALEKLKRLGLGEEHAARELNKSRGWIQIRYMLLDLPKEIQEECASGIIKQVEIRQLYSIQGRDNQLEAAKRIKEARARGEKGCTINVQKKKKTDKRLRKRGEIFEMMEHIQAAIGSGLFTRTMAWCAGEITDMDLFSSIKTQAEEQGVEYAIPNDGEY